MSESVGTLKYVQTTNIDIPNFRDKNNWYAGGVLRNSIFPGGINFSPTAVPNVLNKSSSPDISSFLMSGNYSFLNTGMVGITSFMSGEFFDLLNSVREKETRVLQVDITVTQTDVISNSLETSSGGGFEYESSLTFTGSEYASVESPYSMSEVATVARGGTGLIGNIMSAHPVGIAFTITNVLTGDKLTVKQRISAEVFSYTKTQLTSVFGQKLGVALGIASPLQMVGFLGIFAYVAEELWEMAVGLDNHFGFGGEYMGTYQGTDFYSNPLSIGEGLLRGLEESLGLSGGYTDMAGGPASLGGIDTGNDMASYGIAGEPEDDTNMSSSSFANDVANAVGIDTAGAHTTSIKELNEPGFYGIDVSISAPTSSTSTTTSTAPSTGDVYDSLTKDTGDDIGGTGDDTGGEGSVICTVYREAGIIPEEDYKNNEEFGKNVGIEAYQGYLVWGKPMARLLRKNKFMFNLMKPLVIIWSDEMNGRSTKLGRMMIRTGVPFSRTVKKIKNMI